MKIFNIGDKIIYAKKITSIIHSTDITISLHIEYLDAHDFPQIAYCFYGVFFPNFRAKRDFKKLVPFIGVDL